MTDGDENKLYQLETDENGKPLHDGYVTVYLNDNQFFLRYPFKDYSYNYMDYGFEVVHDRTKNSDIIPWHRIQYVKVKANSDDYVMAIQMFIAQCDHVWDEHHHPIAAMCQRSCNVCGHVEQCPHDDDETEQA